MAEENNNLSSEKPAIDRPAKVKKKSEITKFANQIISEDAGHLGSHFITEIAIPSIKKFVVDAGKTMLDWIFYGFKGGSSSRSPSGGNIISYEDYYKNRSGNNTNRQQQSDSFRQQTSYALNDLIFEDRYDEDGHFVSGYVDANTILKQMKDYLETYGEVSVAFLYLKAKVSYTWVDNDWGWKSLEGAEPVRARDGWMLRLPKIVSLKK